MNTSISGTDGVWMTVREHSDITYVMLDFEGLGSFERSAQEDMLLSARGLGPYCGSELILRLKVAFPIFCTLFAFLPPEPARSSMPPFLTFRSSAQRIAWIATPQASSRACSRGQS